MGRTASCPVDVRYGAGEQDDDENDREPSETAATPRGSANDREDEARAILGESEYKRR